ncbi:MAG: hypothetical protein OEZ36_11445 [Spirochaetota bacterium]|nr:hypothetical protein [Spirochaetota bacterium]
MRADILFLIITVLFLFNVTGHSEKRQKLLIDINSKTGDILINGRRLSDFKPSMIEKVLSKPDRSESHKSVGHMKKWKIKELNKKNLPPTIRSYDRIDYYYLYDKLGIMFFTENLKEFTGYNKTPKYFSIYFLANDKHPHKPRLFKPKTVFSGDLHINGIRLMPAKARFPRGLDNWDKTIHLYNTTFKRYGKTSIYCFEEETGVRLFLYFNPGQDRGISFLELKK